MKIFKIASFLLLLSLFSFNLTFAQQKVDTVFVGKATSKTIKQSIDKKALVYIIVRHGEKENNGKNPHLSEAGKEPLTDCFNRGYITAIKDLLNISVEELE